MFQSDDFDVDFLDSNNDGSEEFQFNPVKQICPENVEQNKHFEFVAPSTSRTNQNILDILSKTKCSNNFDKSLNNTVHVPLKKSPNKHRRIVQRKFPGPAGLLPENKIDINLKHLEENDVTINKTVVPDEIICSQLSGNCFKESPWVDMLKEYYLGNYSLYLPEKYSILWTKTKAMSKQLLGQKTPFLAAIIKSIDYTIKNPMVVLKDPTGEITGTLHHEVWEEHSANLHVGCILVLRQVGVLTTVKKYYLNITANNIIAIYHYTDLSTQDTQCFTQTKSFQVKRLKNHNATSIKQNIDDCKMEFQIRNNSSIVEANDNPFFKHNASANLSLSPKSDYSFRNILKENSFANHSHIESSSKSLNRQSSETNNMNHNFRTHAENVPSCDVISGSEYEKTIEEILKRRKEQNHSFYKPYVTNMKIAYNEHNENLRKRKCEDFKQTNICNVERNSNIILGTPEVISKIKRFDTSKHNICVKKIPDTAENIVKNIFGNKPSFKFASNTTVKENVNYVNNKNDFFTSTQNSDNKNTFCDGDNMLEGLEDSFLEDF